MAYMSSRFMLILLLSAFVTIAGCGQVHAQQSGNRVALAIANANYPDADGPLKETIGTTRALADELKRLGFEVEVGENLSKEQMRAALDRFYGKISADSTALIFFGGYGIQSNRQTYIIPVNAQIWTEADVRRDGLNLDSILAEMNSKGARVKIAILDASRRNPFERRFRAVPAGLAPVIAPRNTAVMYAAAPSMVMRDGDSPLFVTELLKAMRSPGKIEDVFNRTLSNVSHASRDEQAPWFSSSLVDEFSFSSTAPPARDREADARNDYHSAERIGTRRAWEDFLARHPSGRYADLARDRLRKLTPSPTPSTKPKSDPDASARDEYQSAERIGTRKALEDFLLKYPTGRYAELARDRLPKLTRPHIRPDDPAIRELDRRLELNPNDAAALYRRGQLLAQIGDHRRAIEDFNKVLRLNPRDPEALNNRCWTRALVGELQSAMRDCDQALHIEPSYVDALDSRALVNLKLNQPCKSITDYDLALRIKPRHASSLYGRGIARLQIGNTSAGNSDIAAAKSIQPTIAEEFDGYGLRADRLPALQNADCRMRGGLSPAAPKEIKNSWKRGRSTAETLALRRKMYNAIRAARQYRSANR
jgi:tetratricopeptide (TPR) repeat protein